MSMPADDLGSRRYRPDGSYEVHSPESDGGYQVVFPVWLSEVQRQWGANDDERLSQVVRGAPVTIAHNWGSTDVHVPIPPEDAYVRMTAALRLRDADAAFNRFGEEYRHRSVMTSDNDSRRWQHEPWHWPTRDDEYPCQLCWAVNRWPWEPARGCPITVPVEVTYCDRHRELVA